MTGGRKWLCGAAKNEASWTPFSPIITKRLRIVAHNGTDEKASTGRKLKRRSAILVWSSHFGEFKASNSFKGIQPNEAPCKAGIWDAKSGCKKVSIAAWIAYFISILRKTILDSHILKCKVFAWVSFQVWLPPTFQSDSMKTLVSESVPRGPAIMPIFDVSLLPRTPIEMISSSASLAEARSRLDGVSYMSYVSLSLRVLTLLWHACSSFWSFTRSSFIWFSWPAKAKDATFF